MLTLTTLRGETGAKRTFLRRLGFRRTAVRPARCLHDQAVAQSRAPALYAQMGVADSPEGRFEVLVLHMLLLTERLRGAGAPGTDLSQRLFDVFLRDLDGALREMAVGDLAVPRRMRRLGAAYYGRARALDGAIAALPDEADLEAVMQRTVLAGRAGADPSGLAAYVLACRRALAETSDDDLMAGVARWPSL